MQKLLIALTLVAVAFAGCAGDAPVDDPAPVTDPATPVLTPTQNVQDLVAEAVALNLTPITLVESVVGAAVDRTGDLYEPTMEVCDDGSIYITAHTIAVDSTGAPVFGSHDGGQSWAQLPFLLDQTMPGDLQGATPPVTDEIFLACGDDGWLYGVDITLASYPVNAWSGYGSEHSYWNFNGYDESKVATQASECVAVPAKDRPWGAYSNGTLLLVSNPAGGAAQIGVVDVPFAYPAAIGAIADGIEWNLCAGPGGSIPGIPDISSKGDFAVPQRNGGDLKLVVGNKADVMDVQVKSLFAHSSGGEITSVYGQAAYDAEDTLFVGISENTAPDANGTRAGQLHFAVSMDAGQTFQDTLFQTGPAVVHFYMDANKFGPGALVVWASAGETSGYDWYMAHLFANATGAPTLTNAFRVIASGPAPSAHVTGAAVGPDGGAYTAMYTTRAGSATAPTTPLSVYMQTAGPRLPVTMMQPVAAVQS